MKQETRVFICEKCKNEFPGVGRLKKHIRKVHDVRKLSLEENSKFAAFEILSNIQRFKRLYKIIIMSGTVESVPSVKSVKTNFLA